MNELTSRFEESLTTVRSACTDALEIIHKPAANWDLDRLLALARELDDEAVMAHGCAARLVQAIDLEEGDDQWT